MGIQGESKTDQMFLLLETQKTARIKFNWNLVLYKTHYSENSSSDSFIYYLYLHLPSRVGDTSSRLAREENGWFIQVNSVSAAACVDFPYGVSVPLHCIFPTHTLYTAFHVEENHSHLCNFRGTDMWNHPEGGQCNSCVRAEGWHAWEGTGQKAVRGFNSSCHSWKMRGMSRSWHGRLAVGRNVLTS